MVSETFYGGTASAAQGLRRKKPVAQQVSRRYLAVAASAHICTTNNIVPVILSRAALAELLEQPASSLTSLRLRGCSLSLAALTALLLPMHDRRSKLKSLCLSRNRLGGVGENRRPINVGRGSSLLQRGSGTVDSESQRGTLPSIQTTVKTPPQDLCFRGSFAYGGFALLHSQVCPF